MRTRTSRIEGRGRRAVAVLLAAGALALLATGCPPKGSSGPKQPKYPELAARDFYLCCTLHFNKDGDANDAGYVFSPETIVPAGTRVRVIGDGENRIELQPENADRVYTLSFRYGKAKWSSPEWFRMILLETDPLPTLGKLTPDLKAAIAEGRLVVGMTKAQAIAARSYPPFHRTASIDADEWMYFQNGQAVDVVTFANGRIASITLAKAPGAN